ncbi:uncharacterized protein LOC124445661 isoform X4 [Xenia sp. Carnegie-2017]|uniref:uncharacterized protein LOC124445661 isoform X4 n=1 Tax=Xenia sp. Carnegie-2017 TaxID=2897299 RepID=UPI001F03C726|nr:uncharacterized protein LOC124445661 isoform X4 [Xenia sp. Carnegie-2017]
MEWIMKSLKNFKYSYAVEAGLKTEYLPPNLINELIRDVCTSVLRFTSHPSKTERVKIALMIVESYPFLKDPLLDANSKPWGSIEMKIYNRFKKLQRKRSNTPVTNVLQTKGKTTKKRNSHCWTNVPEPCESEDLTAVVSKIKKEWQSAKKNHEKIQELMAACYASRRSLVLEEVRRIVEVVEMFPPLAPFTRGNFL